MSRFLVFSDLHLNLWKYGAVGTSRLDNQIAFLEEMCIYASDNNIRHILFCGDFFHTSGHVKTEVLQQAYLHLNDINRSFGVEFIYIVGNHDQADKQGKIHSLDFLSQFGQCANEKLLELPDMPPICGLNYTEDPDKLSWWLSWISEKHKKVTDGAIVLLHQGVHGVEVNSKGFKLNEILTPDMIPDNVLHVFAGHYHSFKRVNDKLTIPGAPMQFNWGDAGEERGFLDVMYDGRNLHIKFVPSNCRKFIKIDCSGLEDIREELITNGPPPYANDFIKVINVPNRLIGDDIRKILVNDSSYQFVEIEYQEEENKEIEAEKFDTFDQLFEEYVKSNKLSGRRLEVGKEVMSNKYEAP